MTCTDMAVLSGGHPEVCYAKYGSMPTKGVPRCAVLTLTLTLTLTLSMAVCPPKVCHAVLCCAVVR